MPEAIEHIRRMRGGAQAHLLRCDDEHYYIVKFQNNPQGVKVLANELLGTQLARRLGLPTPVIAVVEVGEDLIRYSDDLVMQLGRGQVSCQAGLSFGSRYPGDPALLVVYDLLPEEHLRAIENLADFAGMLVFDKWTCNTNGRQTIFFRPEKQARYQAMMIDQGFCFNASEWNFPDAPLRGLYSRQLVYEPVRSLEAFEPWLSRLERIDEAALEKAAQEIPPEWYNFENDSLWRVLEQLVRRKKLVRELLLAAWKSSRQPFPNWT
jgi:hypothetical protein